MNKIITSVVLTSTLAMAGGDIAPVEEEVIVEESSAWEQRVVIYGWLPTRFDGTLKYSIPGMGDTVSVETDDLIDNLKMTFMAAYEARKDKWSFKADAIYMNLGNAEDTPVSIDDGPVLSANVDQGVEAWIVNFAIGYNMIDSDGLLLDILVGARYLSMDATADINLYGTPIQGIPVASLAQSAELWDGVVGVKGSYNLNENWYLPYHFDIGAGDSDLTWQALAGVGYRYSWGDVLLAYRYIGYEGDGTKLITGLDLAGPAIGVNFKF